MLKASETSDMDYQRLYEYRFRAVDESRRAAVWSAIGEYIYEELGRPRSVLDPAAGRGEFINAVPAEERWAVDQVAYQEGGPDAGVELIISNVMEADLPANRFELVFVSNFLEHLPDQLAVAAFLSKMHRHVAPGGRIAILGPNYRYCSRSYWDFADHSVALTHLAVQEHLHTAGFKLTRTSPRFLPYSFTGRLPASKRMTALYLRQPLAWRVLGKQFLVVGTK
jgi:SAM-dependent methyltransferase